MLSFGRFITDVPAAWPSQTWPPTVVTTLRQMSDLDVPQLPGHVAHRVHGWQARKPYVCPACGNGIGAGVGHVVAWADGDEDGRRHWHGHCWRAAARRGRIA